MHVCIAHVIYNWATLALLNQLQTIQNKALKLTFQILLLTPTTLIHENPNLDNLTSRYNLSLPCHLSSADTSKFRLLEPDQNWPAPKKKPNN